MKLLFIVGVLLLIGCGVMLIYDNVDTHQESYDRIDTGLTPTQTWDIIKGVDVGEALNLSPHREVEE